MEKSSANLLKAKLAPTTREKIAKCVCCGAERDEVKNGKPRFNSDHSFIVHRSNAKRSTHHNLIRYTSTLLLL